AFLPVLMRWFGARAVGLVVVATVTVVAHREGIGLFIARRRRWSLAGTLALTVAVGVGTFVTELPVLYLSYPPLLLLAVRHRFAGVGLGVVALALAGAIATSQDLGPFAQAYMDPGERIVLLQLYIAGACLMTIPVCLAMAERDRLAANLRESERRYRMLADHSQDAIVRIGVDGRRAYISPSASAMVGGAMDGQQASHWDVIHPDDRERQHQAIAEVLASGEPSTDIYRLCHRDGHSIWVEAVTMRIPADDGDGYDLMVTARDIDLRVAAEQALAESL